MIISLFWLLSYAPNDFDFVLVEWLEMFDLGVWIFIWRCAIRLSTRFIYSLNVNFNRKQICVKYSNESCYSSLPNSHCTLNLWLRCIYLFCQVDGIISSTITAFKCAYLCITKCESHADFPDIATDPHFRQP